MTPVIRHATTAATTQPPGRSARPTLQARLLFVLVLTGVLLPGEDGSVEAQLSFDELATLAVINPQSVVSADFDNDGRGDLAIASTVTGKVEVTLADPATTFGPLVSYDTGSPYYLATADINDDGNVDVVACNLLGSTLSIMLGNGTGDFTILPGIPCGTLPTSVAIADFDEDGNLDLVASCHGAETIEVYFGDGFGLFPASLTLTFVDNPSFVVAGDFNEDDHADIIVSNSLDSTFGLFAGNGLGQFPVIIPFNLGIDDAVWTMAVQDLNGDGRPDIVAPCPNQNLIAILLGTPGGGFSGSVVPASGEQPHAALIGDFSLDTVADIATVNSGSDNLAVNLGLGDGTYSLGATFATGNNAVALTSIDLNLDGRLDLVVANLLGDCLTIFVNTTEAPVPAFIRGDATLDSVIDIADAISILSYLFAGGESLPCKDAADANDSGVLDVADAVLVLESLFAGGPPFSPTCGFDQTDDDDFSFCSTPSDLCD